MLDNTKTIAWTLAAMMAIGITQGVAVCEARQDEAATKDFDNLQGKWNSVSWQVKARTRGREELAGSSMTIKGNKISYEKGGKPYGPSREFRLNPEKTPKEIDAVNLDGPMKGTNWLGIYELTGDQLKFTLEGPGRPRPRDFDPTASTRRAVMVFERISDKAADPPAAEAGAKADARPLAEKLIRNPVIRPDKGPEDRPVAGDRERLFLMDLASGVATPVVDEPGRDSIFCGSPCWAPDGRRILFDSYPPANLSLSHLWSIDLADAPGKAKDLGTGNCPTFGADGRRIGFLSNAEGVQSGIYTMNADGTGRAHLGAYGRPRWSPDGKQILICDFATPCTMGLLEVETSKIRLVRLPGKKFSNLVNWAGAGTLVAIIGDETPDTVALIDVSKPDKVAVDLKKGDDGEPVVIDPDDPEGAATIREVLWKPGQGPEITAACPVYDPGTRRCVFIGVGPKGQALYSVLPGDPAPPRRLEPGRGLDPSLSDLAISPDGRFLLFNSKDAAR